MLNPLDLTGKSFLVTGASSGLGRAIAIMLSQLGANLILSARNESALNDTLSMMDGHERHLVAPFDFSQDLTVLKPWLLKLTAAFSQLDGAVHCLGIYKPMPLKALSDKAIEETFNINSLSALRLCAAFRHQRIATDGPKSIVLISSIRTFAGATGTALYAATKGSLTALTKSLAVELAPEHIRVNSISPAFINTALTKQFLEKLPQQGYQQLLNRHLLGFGEPSDVANAAAFLLSNASKWITGTNMIVDGGFTAQ